MRSEPVHSIGQVGSATHLLSPGEFAMILNSESRGVCVISPEGLCRFVTPSFCRMFGVQCDEVIGRVLPSFLKQLAVRPGESSPSSNREREMVLTRKDGSAFPARVRMEELALEGPNTGSVYF